MITKRLKELVSKEAANLKKHATNEELNKLNFSEMEPIVPEYCVYGQMTGSCFSGRAYELIKKCATPYSGGLHHYTKSGVQKDFGLFRFGGDFNRYSYTPIEFYTANAPNKKVEGLIDYLKGKSETLEL